MLPIIKMTNVNFGYNVDCPILNCISASIMPGQLITLLGPNGVGKSTLLNCITGLINKVQGEIMLCGNKISELSSKNIARKIAYVSQKTSVSFDYSVMDFVLMGRTSNLNIFSTPKTEDYISAESALEQLDVLDFKDRKISELSGGEQQKVCIARAIVQNPELIIMDEPTSALDYGNQIRVLKLITQLSKKGYAVLMTTHNPEHPLLLNSDVWILNREGKLECGTCETMITEEKLHDLYDTNICLSFVPKARRTACVVCPIE